MRLANLVAEPRGVAPATGPLWWLVVFAAGLTLAIAAGAVAALSPTLTIAGCLGAALVGAVIVHPPLGAYAVIGVTPLVVGIERGALIPLLRPSEALLLLIGGALLGRAALRSLAGEPVTLRPTQLDFAIAALAATASVLPLAWMYARARPIEQDDVLHSLQLWKYYAVFLIVRASIGTAREVRRCLFLSLGVGAVVAAVAVLQSLGAFGVRDVLNFYYAQFGSPGPTRGMSTLGSSFATGNVMAFNLAIAAALLLRGERRRAPLLAVSPLFLLGAFATGQFSAAIALVAAVAAVGILAGRLLKMLLALAPAVVVGSVLLKPVIATRLSELGSPTHVPYSWLSRLENLRLFFWPETFSDWNLLLGVRTSARVLAPAWRKAEGVPGDFLWIESGHTWLLWTGGIPALLAFLVFVWVAARTLARVARERSDAVGAAAVAGFAALFVTAVLMTIDNHLTLRGSADLLFSLLALASAAPLARGMGDASVRRA